MGDLHRVESLLEQGADLNQLFGTEQHTALHVLADSINPDPELAKYLIESGIDVLAKNRAGETAWDLIWTDSTPIRDKEGQFLAVLIESGYEPDFTPPEESVSFLHDVVDRCHSTILVRLLAERDKETLEVVDENGWTALHHAAFDGNYEAADGLLLAGANPNAETTKTLSDSYLKGETTILRYRYEAGSRPWNLYHKSPGRLTKDFKELLINHGGSKNPDVENKFQIGYGLQ